LPSPHVQTITLKTEITGGGEECVRRDPTPFDKLRKDTDIVRVENGNSPSSGKAITVTIRPSEAKKLFDPVPAEKAKLKPGDFIEWPVKASIPGKATVNFETDPGQCGGHDQDDITISC
jgi:hypothetical protein